MRNFIIKASLLWAVMLLAPTSLYADDTEIFFARANADDSQNQNVANVMILLDTSGSMRNCEQSDGANWCNDAENRRIAMLVRAFNIMIDDIPDDVRVGISRFRRGQTDGGHVMVPVIETTPGNRSLLKRKVAELNSDGQSGGDPEGGTPTSEAYYEMYRYMMGLSPVYGDYSGNTRDADPQICLRQQVDETCTDVPVYEWQRVNYCDRRFNNCERFRGQYYLYTQTGTEKQCSSETTCIESADIVDANGNYVSPMNLENQCESNHVIVMTDGAPSSGSDNLGWNCSDGGSISGSYACQRLIAGALNTDENPKGRKVLTSNIGLYMGSYEQRMSRVSAEGGGATYNADSADALAQAFIDQLKLIDEESKSFSSPGVAVNQMNRLEHLDQLYYSVFRPRKSSVWEGNLKRYKMDDQNVIRDVNGASAVDSDTGYFSAFSKSWWSPETDGFDASEGGARSQLNSRKLFVSDSTGSISELTQAEVNDDNITTDASFGIPANTDKDEFDSKEEVYAALKTLWADPLHSVPLLVNYEGGDADDPSTQTNYIFVSTNGGMLHAIDPDDGSEKFTFMPEQFVKKAYDFVSEPPLQPGNIRKPYGLDGSWIAWRRPEINGSGERTGDAANVYIYGGMRRGGDSYFGLDVSNIDSPSMMWQIDGGYDGDADSGFELLGQTWSTPTLTQVKIGGTRKPVLVFGGGYSPEDHDTAGQRSSEDEIGRAVFMVDALTGDLVWSASKETNNSGQAHTSVGDMDWAVPGGVSVVDLDFDGFADYLYFADLGGQIFRVNLDNGNDGAAGLVEGVTRLASLAGSGTAEHRRFYEAPAVGYKSVGGEALYVAIGSGYRAHPLNEDTTEAIFSIRDDNFREVGGDGDTITLSDLRAVPSTPDDSKSGWYHMFSDGEKVLSSPAIYNGQVLFSTYAPGGEDLDDDPCVVRYGEAGFYSADMVTGATPSQSDEEPYGENSPLNDIDWSGVPLEQSTIPPGPSVIYRDGGNKVAIIVGTEVVGAPDAKFTNLRKNRWYMMQKDEAQNYVIPQTGDN
jgi:type IV pilus assembly protein PilY1|tara:strand:- start:532 stop:3633 length:3102 start_codon:yes stop_codon:yes gene_type:complete